MYTDGKNRVVVPKKIADGKPWVWRARFFGHEPQFDIAMLNRGYHVVYCDVSNLFGHKSAVEKWDNFYNYLKFEHLFSNKVILEGFSRGGLIIYNWAAKNPDKVAAIYADAPVMNLNSWPNQKCPAVLKQMMKLYGFKTNTDIANYKLNPINTIGVLAKYNIPIIHVVGDADTVVLVKENTAIAEKTYKKLSGTFKVIHKAKVGHHPHSLKDPQPIVDFIINHTTQKKLIKAENIISNNNFILRSNFQNSRFEFENKKRGHVAFLGGSITEMNGYRSITCDMLKKRFPKTKFTFTNAGISSTCSDTGAFRLQRDVLSKGLLIFCLLNMQ